MNAIAEPTMSLLGPLPKQEPLAWRLADALSAAKEQGAEEMLERLKSRLDFRLNEYLCEMKPEYDDSVTGFNEAWDVVRNVFGTQSPLPHRPGGHIMSADTQPGWVHDDLRERVALAVRLESIDDIPSVDWHELREPARESWRKKADSILAAFHAAGLEIVRREEKERP